MKRVVIYLFILIVVLLIDIISKDIVNHTMMENDTTTIIENFLYFTLVYNYGTTFGLFEKTAPYITIIIMKSIFIVIMIYLIFNITKIIKSSKNVNISIISFIIIISGSLGNIIDRLSDKRVTDFIDIGIFEYRWHIFNMADLFQFSGGIMIIIIIIMDYWNSKYYLNNNWNSTSHKNNPHNN